MTDPHDGPLPLALDDLRARPWRYPGSPAPASGLLRAGRLLPMTPATTPAPGGAPEFVMQDGTTLTAALRDTGEAVLSERALVVAIGSNASAAVLHRKLTDAGCSTTIPVVTGTITGVAVGHSAHVSRPGYVPAAPYRRPGVTTTVVASWPDTDQLAAIDATEPTYRRVTIPADLSLLRLDGGACPPNWQLYVSRHDLLALPAGSGRIVPLTGQADLFARLAETCPAVAGCIDGRTVAEATSLLADDPALRVTVRDSFRTGGLVAPSGIGDQVTPAHDAPAGGHI